MAGTEVISTRTTPVLPRRVRSSRPYRHHAATAADICAPTSHARRPGSGARRRPRPADRASFELLRARRRRASQSADEYRHNGRAEVVGPSGRFLDDAEELDELVVGRVARCAGVVDQDLEPHLAGVPGEGLAVRAV